MLEGRVVGGDFEVIRLIATGGMGAVYEATQRSTGKARALKVMHAWMVRDPKMRARFVEEARTAGSIDSDHVVEVLSAGIDEELDAPWIAMELLRGETLADHLERTGAVSADECIEVLSQVRDGLQLAHDRGLVHRDLKPENLFVAAARRRGVRFTIKLLDFGIAKWIHEARGGMKNSQPMGTPSWMAPEQLSPGEAIAPAADVWALGLLGFWMLTGKEYWLAANDGTGSVSALLLELVTKTPEPASVRADRLGSDAVLSDAFDRWFARCIARSPDDRFPDAAACVDALEQAIESGGAPRSSAELDLASVLRQARSSTEDLRRAAAGISGKPDDDRSFWVAQAFAASTGEPTPELARWLARRRKPRPTARPLGAGSVARLWPGSPELAPLTRLCELIAEPLVVAAHAERAAPSQTRHAPDIVEDAVRHAALVLGASDVALVPVGGAEPSFGMSSLSPIVLTASSALRAESSPLLLRAKAAVAIARTSSGLGLVGALSGAAELEQARKAAAALARGSISQSKHYRPLVTRLGSRRDELASAVEGARECWSAAWWIAAQITLARAALLASADLASAIAAVAALAPEVQGVPEALSEFILAPEFPPLWHRPSSSMPP